MSSIIHHARCKGVRHAQNKILAPDTNEELADRYCGPACVQMILSSLGVDIVNKQQDRIFAITSIDTGDPAYGSFWSYPDQVAVAINSLQPVSYYLDTDGKLWGHGTLKFN